MAHYADLSRHTRLVLAAFAECPGDWRYGYDLCRQVGIKSGTLYPMLIRLAGRKLLAAEWHPPEKPGRPARHAYRLTAEGLALARAQPAPAVTNQLGREALA